MHLPLYHIKTINLSYKITYISRKNRWVIYKLEVINFLSIAFKLMYDYRYTKSW